MIEYMLQFSLYTWEGKKKASYFNMYYIMSLFFQMKVVGDKVPPSLSKAHAGVSRRITKLSSDCCAIRKTEPTPGRNKRKSVHLRNLDTTCGPNATLSTSEHWNVILALPLLASPC